jgi:hypothetical protein
MKDQEVVLVIDVDFRSEVYHASAILKVEGMEMILTIQDLQIFFRRSYDM